MARVALLKTGLTGVAVMAALTACSAAPAASPVAVATPSSAAAPTASPLVVASESPAPMESSAPSEPAKPRPSIDQAELDAILTSSITLVDLADGDVAVTVEYIDADTAEPFDLGTYTLASLDQQTNQVPPGTYRLEFHQPASSATGATCTFELGDGQAFTFAAVEGAVAIAKAGQEPTDAGELFISTSSLCVG